MSNFHSSSSFPASSNHQWTVTWSTEWSPQFFNFHPVLLHQFTFLDFFVLNFLLSLCNSFFLQLLLRECHSHILTSPHLTRKLNQFRSPALIPSLNFMANKRLNFSSQRLRGNLTKAHRTEESSSSSFKLSCNATRLCDTNHIFWLEFRQTKTPPVICILLVWFYKNNNNNETPEPDHSFIVIQIDLWQ